MKGVLSGEMRRNPHVQSYVVAVDQVLFLCVFLVHPACMHPVRSRLLQHTPQSVPVPRPQPPGLWQPDAC